MGHASGLNNTGIMHAVINYGMKPLCGRRNALMATTIENFRTDPKPCLRCKAKLADLDARMARRDAQATPAA
jgi:hypothetical protein